MKKGNIYAIIFSLILLFSLFSVVAIPAFDLNGDGSVTISDLSNLAQLYRGKGAYNASYDFNNDTKIDLFDLVSVAKNISSLSNNDSNTSEPFYDSGIHNLVYEDDMESYSDITAMGTIDPGIPTLVPNPSPLGGSGTWTPSNFGFATGRNGTGQSLRVIRDGVPQGPASSFKTLNMNVPGNTDNTIHYFQHWAKVQMNSTLSSPLNVKWFMAWHDDGSRIQWNTFWATGGLPAGGLTYWQVYDQGGTTSQGAQPLPPIFTTVANSGEWHRFTYAFKPNSAPGARDGFARMWVNGTKIIDVSADTVGITPSGGGKVWCNWDDVDSLSTRGVYYLNWPSVQTTTTPAWTMDVDDLMWWTE